VIFRWRAHRRTGSGGGGHIAADVVQEVVLLVDKGAALQLEPDGPSFTVGPTCMTQHSFACMYLALSEKSGSVGSNIEVTSSTSL